MTVNDLTPDQAVGHLPPGMFYGVLRTPEGSMFSGPCWNREVWPDLVAAAQPFLCGNDSPTAQRDAHDVLDRYYYPDRRHAANDCSNGKLRVGYQADQGGRANLAVRQKVQLVKLEREWLGRTVSYRGKTWQVWALAPDKDSLPAVWLVADGVAVHASLSYVHVQGDS